MHEDRTQIIFGPPGTGKTTRLLEIVDQLIDEKIPTEGIVYLAFTRRGALEASSRAMRKFKKPIEDFPWFRTIHSLCFTQLGLKPQQVMGPFDYSCFASTYKLRLTTKWSSDGNPTYIGSSPDDLMLSMDMMARASSQPLETLWEKENDLEIRLSMVRKISKYLREFKKDHGKLDFVDILQKFLESGTTPPHLVLIVDEAQDLSPLQWKVIDKISESTRKVFIAGDDDQAIFKWAGADAEALVRLPGERVILPKSYRVPSNIQKLGMRVLERIRGPRVAKSWEPVEIGGQVVRINDVSEAPLGEGKWLILCRNLYSVEQMSVYCLGRGFLFESQSEGTEIITRGMVRAVNAWENLRKDRTVTVADALDMYSYMSVRTGYSKGFKSTLEREDPEDVVDYAELRNIFGLRRLRTSKWMEVLDRIPKETQLRIEQIRLNSSTKEMPEPTIRISTIHSAKGAEEDNVLLVTDMSRKVADSAIKDPDSEHRVWYVAVTRAKKSLYVLSPQTLNYYEL